MGAQLPTEHELCRQLGVSRFTIREAIRVLSNAGLVRRKPRAGTLVAALPDDTRYSHGISSLRDLFQYAQSTHFHYVYIGRVGLTKAQARALSAAAGEEWIHAVALRRETAGAKPFGVTRLFLNPALKGIEKALRSWSGAVYALIERDFGVRIGRVEQVIAGDRPGRGGCGQPRRARRRAGAVDPPRYFDEGGRLVEMADTVHPADRFAYRMELRR